jgi:hypothetical protein
MKQPIRARIRAWLLRKLGAIDREEAETFAQQYLQGNGRAVVTVTASDTSVIGRTIRTDPGQMGVAVAPWARHVYLAGLVFEPKGWRPSGIAVGRTALDEEVQPVMRAVQADIIRRMREDLRPHLDAQADRLDAMLDPRP